jgi:hypothetical protein
MLAQADPVYRELRTRADRRPQPFHRLAHFTSLIVMMSAIARASAAARWIERRSVLRRSWPKFDRHELVRSTG